MSESLAFRAALSVLSGRVDVCDLPSSSKKSLGIGFDPKNSIQARNSALECVECCLAQVLLSGSADSDESLM